MAIVFAGLSFGDSFYNPWIDLKVSLKVAKGATIENALDMLFEKTKQEYPLKYELYLSKYVIDTTKTVKNALGEEIAFENQPLGIIMTGLVLSAKSRFRIEQSTIRVFSHSDQNEMSDQFYLVPTKVKLREKTNDGVKKYFVGKGLIIPKDSNFEVDYKLEMLLIRGSDAMHKKVKEILCDDHGPD